MLSFQRGASASSLHVRSGSNLSSQQATVLRSRIGRPCEWLPARHATAVSGQSQADLEEIDATELKDRFAALQKEVADYRKIYLENAEVKAKLDQLLAEKAALEESVAALQAAKDKAAEEQANAVAMARTNATLERQDAVGKAWAEAAAVTEQQRAADAERHEEELRVHRESAAAAKSAAVAAAAADAAAAATAAAESEFSVLLVASRAEAVEVAEQLEATREASEAAAAAAAAAHMKLLDALAGGAQRLVQTVYPDSALPDGLHLRTELVLDSSYQPHPVSSLAEAGSYSVTSTSRPLLSVRSQHSADSWPAAEPVSSSPPALGLSFLTLPNSDYANGTSSGSSGNEGGTNGSGDSNKTFSGVGASSSTANANGSSLPSVSGGVIGSSSSSSSNANGAGGSGGGKVGSASRNVSGAAAAVSKAGSGAPSSAAEPSLMAKVLHLFGAALYYAVATGALYIAATAVVGVAPEPSLGFAAGAFALAWLLPIAHATVARSKSLSLSYSLSAGLLFYAASLAVHGVPPALTAGFVAGAAALAWCLPFAKRVLVPQI